MTNSARTARLEVEDTKQHKRAPYCEDEYEIFISSVTRHDSVMDELSLCTQDFLWEL